MALSFSTGIKDALPERKTFSIALIANVVRHIIAVYKGPYVTASLLLNCEMMKDGSIVCEMSNGTGGFSVKSGWDTFHLAPRKINVTAERLQIGFIEQ